MKLKSINPYTNELIEEFEQLTDQQVQQKIEGAQDAFSYWRNTTFDYRKELLLKVAQQLEHGAELCAKTITSEMGKVLKESEAELKKCAWVCEHYANDAEVLLHREAVATGAYHSYVYYEPLGCVLGIMPWNFPFWQVFRFVAPTLMAGNVVLLKHASNVQMCARSIETLFEKAGFPEGVFQNLVLGSSRVEKVIEHPVVKAVTLTGSEFAGSEVAALAGKNIKKTVLELGGSNAFIVMDDADVEKAVEIGVKARMQNAGQSCIAAKRFFLHKDIAGEYMRMYLERVKKMKIGDPMKDETEMGPLSSIEQAELVRSQLKHTIEKGAEIIYGDKPESALYPPTVVGGVKPGMPLFDEEVFGPVAPMITVNSLDEAIALSNRSKYGLGVSLFTNDLDKAEKAVREFDDGAVFINDLVKSDPRLPFGGTKRSGYGRELAINGIREFVNVKTVYIEKLGELPNEKEDKDAVKSVGSPG